MKKIVGIVAAAAIATSVFAADIASATKINGKLFEYGKDKSISLFTENNDSHDWANPNFTMSISDDRAGATVKITSDGGNKTPAITTQTIWFKPVDALKITAGSYDIALNKEQIDWTESKTGLGGNGFLASINVEGFGLDIGLDANGKNWLSKADGADPAINKIFAKAAFSADFGTIGGFFTYETVAAVAAKAPVAAKTAWKFDDNGVPVRDPDNDTTAVAGEAAKDASKNILFGAGYRNNFSGVDAFVNVVGNMTEKFDWIRPELYIGGSADALGYQLFAAPLIYTNADLKKDTKVELLAKVTYALDGGITPYAYFKSANLLAKTFESTVKVGATGSVGLMGWNCWVQLDVADKTAFSVPFELTVSF